MPFVVLVAPSPASISAELKREAMTGLSIRDAAVASVPNKLDILVERTLVDLERRRLPLRTPPLDLLVRHVHVHRVGLGIDGNHVSVAHERNRSPDLSLRDDMSDHEAV